MAVVASINTISKRNSILPVEHTGFLNQPSQTLCCIHHPVFNDGTGRARIDTTLAHPATIVYLSSARSQWRISYNAAKHKETSVSLQQKIGVLTKPPQPCQVCCSSIDQRVVVGKHHCLPTFVAKFVAHGVETKFELGVVVALCIASNARTGCARGLRQRLRIRVRPNDHGLRIWQSHAWVG